MKKKLLTFESQTKKTVIVALLRKCFLWSRERATVLKRDKYTCQVCGAKKKDGAKIACHHISGRIDFDKIIGVIRGELLVPPDNMITLCRDCHKASHDKKDILDKKEKLDMLEGNLKKSSGGI